MQELAVCPECGAPGRGADGCDADFAQLLGWESLDFARLGSVHHLTVLCFLLQHPSRYSPEGLIYAVELLHAFLDEGKTPAQVRAENRDMVNSHRRQWKITGSPQSHGVYPQPIRWRITAADVVAGGMEGYVENVNAWARAVAEDLPHPPAPSPKPR